MIFKEGELQFDFSDKYWDAVLPFDKTIDYQKVVDSIEHTKGVDFTGIFDNNALVLIEVKDFRKHRIKTKPRIDGNEDPLWLEVSQKMRDSISVMVGACRNSTHEKEKWKSYVEILKDDNKDIHLILWLEQDLPPNTQKARRNRELKDRYLLRKLKNNLSWLTSKIDVFYKSNNSFPEALTVTYL